MLLISRYGHRNCTAGQGGLPADNDEEMNRDEMMWCRSLIGEKTFHGKR